MIRIHVISDLYLDYAQHVDPSEYIIPDEVNLIIFNGNIGPIKRSMYHAETIANIYPDIPVVCNLGESERYYGLVKNGREVEHSLNIRKTTNPSWPKNLYWSTDNIELPLSSGAQVDILCVYGFPKIHYCDKWEETVWFKNYVIDTTMDHNDPRVPRIPGLTHTYLGQVPIWATMEWVNEQHYIEENKVRKWESTQTSYKILVTHLNPYNDPRFNGQVVSPYQIHLNDMLWITSKQKVEYVKFSGARLVSNPGLGQEARSHVIKVN